MWLISKRWQERAFNFSPFSFMQEELKSPLCLQTSPEAPKKSLTKAKWLDNDKPDGMEVLIVFTTKQALLFSMLTEIFMN